MQYNVESEIEICPGLHVFVAAPFAFVRSWPVVAICRSRGSSRPCFFAAALKLKNAEINPTFSFD
jgi:hypothetical protein